VIFKQQPVDGRARVTTHQDRALLWVRAMGVLKLIYLRICIQKRITVQSERFSDGYNVVCEYENSKI